MNGQNETLGKFLETTKFPFTQDYSRQRKLTVTEAIQELIAHVDFAEQKEGNSEAEEYFFETMMPAIPFKNIIIKGSSMFTVNQLTSLITVSRASLEEYVIRR